MYKKKLAWYTFGSCNISNKYGGKLKNLFLLNLLFLLSVLLILSCNSTNPDSGRTVTDIDGNIYQTLIIGDQEWMIENLKVAHYRNGDPILYITNPDVWENTTNGACCVHHNDIFHADTYGLLYNWYAVNGSEVLAPEGWHIPSDEEIMELEMFLGMSFSEAHNSERRGTNEGSKLAGTSLWLDGALQNNPEFGTSSFNFLPGGYRNGYNGEYKNKLKKGFFWSSTENSSNDAWLRQLDYDYSDIARYYYTKQFGLSVRCVRD